jgi:hypothetical protein
MLPALRIRVGFDKFNQRHVFILYHLAFPMRCRFSYKRRIANPKAQLNAGYNSPNQIAV